MKMKLCASDQPRAILRAVVVDGVDWEGPEAMVHELSKHWGRVLCANPVDQASVSQLAAF